MAEYKYRAPQGTHDVLNSIRKNHSRDEDLPRRIVGRIYQPGEKYVTIAPTLDCTGTIRVGFQVEEPSRPFTRKGTQRYSYLLDRYEQITILTAQRFIKTKDGIVDDPNFVPPSPDVLLEEVKAAAGFKRPHLEHIPQIFADAFK